MNLRERMLSQPLASRFSYDPSLNVLFVDFERIQIKSERDVREIRRTVDRIMKSIGHRVFAIVNYTGASITPEVFDLYEATVRDIVSTYYFDVTRYGSSGFLRMKLGNAAEAMGGEAASFDAAHATRKAVMR